MEQQEMRINIGTVSPEELEQRKRQQQLMFRLNHTMPLTPEYDELMHQLFEDHMGEGSTVETPLQVICPDNVKIGKRVFINSNALFMGRGGITIEDDVLIAANVSLISNNHDLYQREVLVCKPVVVKQGAWIGAGATILPGVTVGKYAVVGAASVVTHNVPDYAVVVGSPARVVQTLDAAKFES